MFLGTEVMLVVHGEGAPDEVYIMRLGFWPLPLFFWPNWFFVAMILMRKTTVDSVALLRVH